jgi:iron complex transport system substrate-binding protein
MKTYPNRRRRPAYAAALAIAAVVIAGVGLSSTSSAAGSKTHRAFNGVSLPQRAMRIVSLTDAATEDLFAIGAGNQVVAVDEYSTYPRGVPTTKLSGFAPNVEAIAKYHPDLVITSQNIEDIGKHLAALGIPLLYDGAPNNLSGAYQQITQLGQVTGHASQASALVHRMRRRVASIIASVKKENPSITVYDERDQTYYSVSSNTFIGQMYKLLGLKNIADAAAKTSVYPQLSAEYIIASNPDLIVLADTNCCGQSAKTVAARPGWGAINAVKNHDVLVVNDTIASEWGPRIVDFLADVARDVRKIEAHG